MSFVFNGGCPLISDFSCNNYQRLTSVGAAIEFLGYERTATDTGRSARKILVVDQPGVSETLQEAIKIACDCW